jgi:chemotaxis protein MotB
MEKIKTLEKELDEFKNAKLALENRLAQEINDKNVSVRTDEKGLVITLAEKVLFDSGKAELKEESYPILDKIAQIIKEEAAGNDIGIEGHTDNEPIAHSKWKSNWELSSHRALSVLYYMENQGIDSKKLSANGYGEFHPITDNGTKDGKRLNRRVEIVIKKLQQGPGQATPVQKSSESEEELK